MDGESWRPPGRARAGALARAAARLPANRVTKIRIFFPPNWDRNGAQALPQSNMVVLVDTEAGITGVGQGGSPDTVRNVARSVIGKNAFDTEMIWQAAFMDPHYSPGDERLHALGAIDLALWDIKGKALKVPLYQLFGGKAREHIELYAPTASRRESCRPKRPRPWASRSARRRRWRPAGGCTGSTAASCRARAARELAGCAGRGRPRRARRWAPVRAGRRTAWRRRRARRIALQYARAHSADDQGARADP